MPAFAVVAIAVMAGCGGSSGTTSSGSSSSARTSAPALTKSEFISQADAICGQAKVKGKAEVDAVNAAVKAEQGNDSAANRQALGNALNREIQVAKPVLDQLRALQPPPGDRVVIAKYLGAVASNISLAQQFVTAVESDESQAMQTISQQINQGTSTADGLAQGYGFKVCGSGTS
jgi:hypothetical protein